QYKKSQGERVGTISMGKSLSGASAKFASLLLAPIPRHMMRSGVPQDTCESTRFLPEAPLSLDGKCLVDNAKEQLAIHLAKQCRANGLSLRKIASKLAENNHFNRLGSMYNARSIAIMVGEA